MDPNREFKLATCDFCGLGHPTYIRVCLATGDDECSFVQIDMCRECYIERGFNPQEVAVTARLDFYEAMGIDPEGVWGTKEIDNAEEKEAD